MLSQKPLAALTKADIDALIAEQTPEGRALDYKELLPGNTDSDKKEFLADASSFANAIGGDLIFGVREQRDASGKATGLPLDAPGLAGVNADAEIRRLDAILASGLAPRIPGVAIHAIEGFASGPVLVLRAPRSWVTPHQITFQQWSRFYSRNSAGKYLLDVLEIRAAFALSDALPDRIRRFRDERLARLVAGETPIKLDSELWAALHIVPVRSLELAAAVDIGAVYRQPSRLRPLGASGWNHRYNLDGVCTWSGRSEATATRAYTQLFRTGAIEAVATGLVDSHPQAGRVVRIEPFETNTLKSVGEYVATLGGIGASAPYVILATLVGTRDARLTVPPDWQYDQDTNRIDRDMLTLPEVWLEDAGVDLAAALRPMFDALWQAAGWPQSLYYDDTGKRVSLR